MEAVLESLLGIAGEFLSDAAIDWRHEDDGSIYITSLDFNFWIMPLSDQAGMEFYTYWPFCEGVRTEEAHSFANECNLELQMVQFSISSCGSRLQGHYLLVAPNGIERRHFVHSARMFGEAFAKAMQSDAAYLLAMELEASSNGKRKPCGLTIQ